MLRGPPRLGRFSFPASGAPLPVARRGFWRRLSVSLCLPEEGRGSPRLLGRPLVTCRGQRPRQARRRLAHCCRRRCCLQGPRALRRSVTSSFEAVLTRPMSLRAYASSGDIAATEASLATGPPGLALAGRVSHPLDDFSEFHELPHVFIPFRPALPGRAGSVFGARVAVGVGGSRERCAASAFRLPPTNSLTLTLTPTRAASLW